MTDKPNAQQIVSDADAKATGSTDVELWLKKIDLAKAEEKDWRADAGDAIQVFESDPKAGVHFNIFHSNVQTTLPALYNTTPIADVRRRYGDKDPIGKMAIDITERSLAFSCDQYPFDKYVRAALKDGEVAGRGTVRLRYGAEFGEKQADGQTFEDVTYESVTTEPVKWDKWGRGPGRFWEEVPFVWFEHDLDRDDIGDLMKGNAKRLKEVIATGFGSGPAERDTNTPEAVKGVYKTITVYEVWDKRKREVLFLSPQVKDFPLKVDADPLKLEQFFPVPSPLQPIERLGSLIPVTPYQVYKHLIGELDRITKRINKLVNQLKVRGLVAGDMVEDIRAVTELGDGEFLSSKNALQFATGAGGLEKAIAHWPMEPTVLAIKQLVEQRQQIKELIYEVTGISDILRGASDARETLGAQKIKTQWGNLRLQDRQAEVARFCRDLFRMKTELIARFKPEVLSIMTGLPQSEQDQQVFPQAVQLLKDGKSRRFRIDIETDSTVRADLSRNQEQMNAFMATTAQFVQGLTEAAGIAPQMIPAMIEVYLSFARQFKLNKQAMDAIEGLSQMGEQMKQMAMQAQSQPSPEEQKAKLDSEREDKKLAVLERTEATKLQVLQQTKAAELQFMKEKHALEIESDRNKFAMEQERADWSATNENARAQRQFDFDTRRGEVEEGRSERDHMRKTHMSEAEHGARMNEMAMKSQPQPEGEAQGSGEVSELAQGLQVMAKEQRESTQATLQVLTQIVQQIAAGASAKPKGKAFKRLIRGQDGKAIGMVEEDLLPAEGAV